MSLRLMKGYDTSMPMGVVRAAAKKARSSDVLSLKPPPINSSYVMIPYCVVDINIHIIGYEIMLLLKPQQPTTLINKEARHPGKAESEKQR